MEDEKKILEYLAHPDRTIDLEWVLDMLERYPAFYLPAALYVKRKPRGIDPAMMQQLHTAIVLNCPDRATLADFADVAGSDWANLYPREMLKTECSTEQAIATFIDTYGKHSQENDDELLERLIFTPVAPDYFSGTDEPYDPADPLALPPELEPGYTGATPAEELPPVYVEPVAETDAPLGGEDAAQADSRRPEAYAPLEGEAEGETQGDGTRRPEAYAPLVDETADEARRPEAYAPLVDEPKDAAEGGAKASGSSHEDSSLMETLAKYFIKQQRYERAYEIISKLNLNFPEKSVYFADQLRFLRKVIINRRISRQFQEK